MEGITCSELLEYSLRLLDATLDGGLVKNISDWEPVPDATLDSRLMEGNTHLEQLAPGVSLDSGPMEGMLCLEPSEQSVLNSSLVARLSKLVMEERSEWKPVINPVISYTLDSRLMEGNTYLERSAPGVYLDSAPTEGVSCLEPLEQSVLVSSLAARPVEGITKKVSEWQPVIHPVQDSQPMEETTYLEHSALGVSLDSGLMEGMSRTEPLEQSVLGAWAAVRLEETDMPERPALASQTYHKQACFTLSARPILDSDVAIDTDVNADINIDLPENSAPMMNTDSRLLKCNTQLYPPGQDTQGCRPMKGITETRQVELSGLVLAIDRTNEEHLPPSNSWKRSDYNRRPGLLGEYRGNAVRLRHWIFQSEDAIRREVLRNRSMGYMSSREVNGPLLLPEQVNLSDVEHCLDQVRSEGLWQWNMDMDIEYQYETFNGLPVYYGGDIMIRRTRKVTSGKLRRGVTPEEETSTTASGTSHGTYRSTSNVFPVRLSTSEETAPMLQYSAITCNNT